MSRKTSRQRNVIIRVVSLIIGALCLVLAFEPVQAQRADNLDTALRSANFCGGGAPQETYFTIAAAGDLLLHDNIQATANRLGYNYLFDKVRPFIKAADFSYVNYEGVSVPGAEIGSFPFFSYSPALAPAIKAAGFDIVSTANNHALDRGPNGVDATIQNLEQAGLLYHGTTATGQTRKAYQPFEMVAANGVKIKASLLSFTYSTNGNPDPRSQVNLLWDGSGRVRPEVLAAITQARRETELVVVAAHWGVEYELFPNEQQKQTARELAATGVDILLGDHPHVVQPVDFIDTNGRKTLVIYSLGNFVAGQEGYQPYTQASLIFYAGVSKNIDGRVRVTGYRHLPVYIEENTRPAPILPGFFGEAYRQLVGKMRDPNAFLAVNPDPTQIKGTGDGQTEICTFIDFREVPGKFFSGDFAQYFASLGTGNQIANLREALAIIGFPISEVRQELAGDCQRLTSVLYTERQRLELQTDAVWPFRVVGTQLGAEVYHRKYALNYPNAAAIPRRLNLNADAIVNQRFKDFFNRYGGLSVFGYPLSGSLTETESASGKIKTVQYFERARFEFINGEA